jgi:hypothetical protein
MYEIKTMYVYIYVCTYVCIYVCTYICMYVYMYVCMYVRKFVCVYICMYVCSHVRFLWENGYTDLNQNLHAYFLRPRRDFRKVKTPEKVS